MNGKVNMPFISKEQSNFIKGVAILLMIFHHLFAYSDRYPNNIEIIFINNNIYYEQILGEIGKYCVPIFLFISGYGFGKSSNIYTRSSYFLNKILLCFIAYWLVFVIFVPLSYLFSEWKFVNLEYRDFISNFFALSSSYNGEWWFFLPYIILILLTPIFHRLSKNIISLIGISLILFGMGRYPSEMQNFLYWQPAYILGFIVSLFSAEISSYVKNKKIFLFFSSIFFIWTGIDQYGWDSMPFLVIFFIYIIKTVFEVTPQILIFILSKIGEKSLFIWLTHSFYCYHFAKNFIYYPKYTILIFLNLLFVSYITAYILDFIHNKIVFYLRNKIFI